MKSALSKIPVLLYCLILNNAYTKSQVTLLTQRQIVLNEILAREGDPWPRGDGHVVLAEPGSPLAQKGYHEPGGSFSPSPGSFGVSIWVMDKDNHLIATSDNIPFEKITQHYHWAEGCKIPSVVTETPYYHCAWTYIDMGSWQLNLTKINNLGNRIILTFRSAGPAGGPVNSAVCDKTGLVINRRWKITPDILPVSVILGDEHKGELFKNTDHEKQAISPDGWAFARIEINAASFSVSIKDTRPLFASALTYDKTVPQFTLDVPEKQFMESLNSQIANLMMGYTGRQTCPGEPVNYPLAWERDGAYSLMAMARSGNLKTARELSVYFAEHDFFGGFGAEGDAPGSEINVLTEVAFLLDDPAYDQWLWPHILRKLGYIDEMMNARDSVFKNFIGPLIPEMEEHLKRSQLICLKTENGLIYGAMDHHFPVLYVNAVSYRGLIQASRLAAKLGKTDISFQCVEKAGKIKEAWLRGFGQEKYENDRNYMSGVWPTWITSKDYSYYLQKSEERRNSMWKSGVPEERPLWTYFTIAEAHQWLFLNRPDLTWETLNYFWNNQCSPGLYTFWEGNGEENSFHGWDQIRGWLKPKYVTPHYWAASEMMLLQLDMLAYFDESGPDPVLVIGGGVPEKWTKYSMSIVNYKTRYGTVSWWFEKNNMKILLEGFKNKVAIRTGLSFGNDLQPIVEYN
jgi:hypothetical protein